MKKSSFAKSAAGALLIVMGLAACRQTADSVSSDIPAVLPVVADSVTFRDSIADFSIRVEFPEDASTPLAVAVGEYVSEMLGGTYNGVPGDVSGMLEHYGAPMFREHLEMMGDWENAGGFNLYDKVNVVKYAENGGYVTYFYVRETFLGGAHGSRTMYGMTFRKSDGRRMGWDVFRDKDDEDFAELIKDGLKGYWHVESDRELQMNFLDEMDFYDVPLPECPPLFTASGVEFVYNEYEIAAYALGRPRFTVSWQDLDDHMTVTARNLVSPQGN